MRPPGRPLQIEVYPTHQSRAASTSGKRARNSVWLVLLGLSTGAVLLASHQEQPAVHKAEPPIVQVAVARRGDMDIVENAFGTVLANETVQVVARASGELIAAPFREGDFVRKDDVLFQIDSKPYQAAVAQAEAVLAKDAAQLANAENDARRLKSLSDQGAASVQQRDVSAATAKALSATVQADRANLSLVQLNLGYTTVRSPIDGKTGPMLIQPGNVLPANSANTLVVIMQLQPVKVSFSLPQTDIAQILARQRERRLFVSVVGKSGTAATVPVTFLGNAIDDKSGTIELRASLPNRDLSFVPGQLVDVAVRLDRLHNVIVVPRQAVNFGSAGRYVFAVGNDAIVRARNVKVLFDDGTNEAIAGNVPAGERVITDGQLSVVPGRPATIKGSRQFGASRELALAHR